MTSSTVDTRRATPTLRTRAWQLVEPGDDVGKAVDAFILSLIFLNILAVILETVPELEKRFATLFAAFEIFSVVVFASEYVVRLWACVEHPDFARPIRGRIRYALRPMSIIDLVAILPAFLSLGTVDLRILRGLRLFRLLRVLKATRYVAALALFKMVVKARREELILTTALMLVLLIFASSAMYFVENAAQPDKFSSIPASMWWAVATLTTVGYGDIFPVTPAGKFAAGVVAILGLGFFALPTAIIGSGFVEAMQERREKRCCPHCGRELD